MALVNIHTHSFFDELIGPGATVLDVGANVGQFATAITDRYPCRCVAFEPAPDDFAQIPSNDRIEAHKLAVCGERGEVILNLAAISECNSLGMLPGFDYFGTVKVQAVTLEDALELAGAERIALLKLDIEGSEIGVLATADPKLLARFDQITAEFHDSCGVTPPSVVRETLRKVRKAGFHILYLDRGVRRHVDVLFVNRRHMGSLRCAVEMARYWMRRIVRSARRRVSGRNASQQE